MYSLPIPDVPAEYAPRSLDSICDAAIDGVLNSIYMAYRGKYTPVNKDKYDGDWTSVTYRSLWERKVMTYLDKSPNVLRWSSEEVVIPYLGEDGKRHRYFPDFLAEIKKADGTIETVLIEVKPFKETQPPKPSKDGRVTRQTYISEMIYRKNLLKWQAAERLCEEHCWKFQKIYEHDLGCSSSSRSTLRRNK